MKKSIVLFLLFFQSFFSIALTENYSCLTLDEEQISREFAELNQLEKFVAEHEGLSLAELQTNYPQVLENFKDNPENFNGMEKIVRGGGETPLGIPAFIWGCVLGIIGLVIVALVADDRELTKQALYGCIVSALIGIGLRFGFHALGWGIFGW